MIGIQAVATYLPKERLNNFTIAAALGVPSSQIEGRIGFTGLSRAADDEHASHMAQKAIQALFLQDGVAVESIDLLVAVTQTPDQNIPHLSAELHGALMLRENCSCFDIALGCSGYIYALSVVKSFMEANGLKAGLIVTSDPYSKIVDPKDKATAMIFGDGASATLLSETPQFEIGKFSFGTQGDGAEHLKIKSGHLHMSGRHVFNMAAQKVPANILETLSRNALTLNEVDTVIAHQGSLAVLQELRDRLALPESTVPFFSRDYGNTVSSSIPFGLAEIWSQTELKNIVLSGFGLGFSWASTVLRRR